MVLILFAFTLAFTPRSDGVKVDRESGASAALLNPPTEIARPQILDIVESNCDASFTITQQAGNTYKFTNTSVPLSGPVFKWTVVDEDGIVIAGPTTSTTFPYNFSYTFPKSKKNKTYTVKLEMSGQACGDDPDDEIHSVTIPGIEADFTYEQQGCPNSPLVVKFTNKSFGLNLTYDWSITPPPTPVTYTVQNPVHTFSGPGFYVVCLKVTDSNGQTDQKCTTIEIKTDCLPSFDYVYNACVSNKTASTPITVIFTNTSKGGFCPWTFNWKFDGVNPAITNNAATVTHAYAAYNSYPVTLRMQDSAGCLQATPTKMITLKPCEADFTSVVCPSGRVIYKTDSPNPKWVFPGGSPSSGTGSEVAVQYDHPASYGVAMTSIDENHCRCVIEKKVTVPAIVKCTRNDTETGNWGFSYKGWQYQLRYKIAVRNFSAFSGIHKIKAKAVLFRWLPWLGAWGPTKALTIQASWSGSTYESNQDCACVLPSSENQDSGVQNNRAKAMKIHNLGNSHEFCVRDQDITATYSVKVDSSHTPVVRTLLVGFKKDKCKDPK
jgi:PKD repeat protein